MYARPSGYYSFAKDSLTLSVTAKMTDAGQPPITRMKLSCSLLETERWLAPTG